MVGPRLPLMREDRDIDLDYHVRHSALPHPGGQRELGILVSRLHSHQLDVHRPLWEAHLIEGLEGNRFALYTKIHHSLIDGVSGMRLLLRGLSTDPDERDMKAWWTVGAGKKPRRGGEPSGPLGTGRGGGPRQRPRRGRARQAAAADFSRAAFDDRGLQTPYRTPDSALVGRLAGQRRFATQRYELDRIKALAKAAECSINDIVLYLSGSALRRYLSEHGRLPDRPLTAGHPGQPARARRPVGRDGDRDHDRRAGDEHRRPAAPGSRRSSARPRRRRRTSESCRPRRGWPTRC